MLIRQEINRKLLHTIALLMPMGIFYLPKMTPLSLWAPPFILVLLLICSVLLEYSRFQYSKIQALYNRCFSLMLRTNEETKATGATYIIGGATICAVVFVYSPHISFTVLTLFILGDAIAALVGQGMGRIKLMGKTLEGSLACLGLCFLLCTFVFPHVPFLYEDWGGFPSWRFSLSASVLITVFELFPIRLSQKLVLNDNLYVPVLGGLVLQILLPFIRNGYPNSGC